MSATLIGVLIAAAILVAMTVIVIARSVARRRSLRRGGSSFDITFGSSHPPGAQSPLPTASPPAASAPPPASPAAAAPPQAGPPPPPWPQQLQQQLPPPQPQPQPQPQPPAGPSPELPQPGARPGAEAPAGEPAEPSPDETGYARDAESFYYGERGERSYDDYGPVYPRIGEPSVSGAGAADGPSDAGGAGPPDVGEEPPDDLVLGPAGDVAPDLAADRPLTAPSRYANATIDAWATGQPWPRDLQPYPEATLLLRISIGPLAADSQVDEPIPFPDDYLPRGDLVIDVAVSSTSFKVGRDLDLVPDPGSESAQDQFILPGDGSPARTRDGGTVLTFVLRAPPEPGPARLRILYYYRDAVVQSQLLTMDIGGPDPWSIVTDYTIATALPSAGDIPERPRVAVVINGDGTGHEIYVRTRDGSDGQSGTTAVELPPAIGDRVRDFRKVLASEAIAPTTAQRSRAQLITVLRTLAPLGWDLYAAVFPTLKEALYQLDDQAAGQAVLHVARPAGVSLSVPWALLYTIGIDSKYGPGYQSVPVCPLVGDWDGRSPLVSGDAWSCPHAADVSHASNLLCPFGFLGFCHDIEQLSRTERPVVSISAAAGSSIVVAETAYQVNQRALQQHVTGLRQTISARLPGVEVQEAAGKAALEQLISRDLPLIYFYCHGERPNAASRETYLGIGNREWVTAPDFMSWVHAAYLSRHQRVWDRIRPLVFINACHSAELDPAALFNYVDAFVGAGNAAGVIGTEVKVQQDLAMTFAQLFFDGLLTGGTTVARALHQARIEFLAQGNLFGLTYTPYCWADLTVTG